MTTKVCDLCHSQPVAAKADGGGGKTLYICLKCVDALSRRQAGGEQAMRPNTVAPRPDKPAPLPSPRAKQLKKADPMLFKAPQPSKRSSPAEANVSGERFEFSLLFLFCDFCTCENMN